ncbi:MAG: cyclic pyranopterin monophosphate synthase MoaC [Reichenbachiella sp.]
MQNPALSHVDDQNSPAMVDVSDKKITKRMAKARSIVVLNEDIMGLLENNELQSKKGPVFQTAIIAGTMAAKRTGDLIPLCHPIGLEACNFDIKINGMEVIITCTCTLTAKTGIEMEALTGASLAALTIYDMCKAVSHDIVIKETRLIEKSGGKSHFIHHD